MSMGNIIAMLGAGMGGYARGKQQATDAEAAAQDQEFKQWQRSQMQAQAARDDALRGDLAAAGQQVTPTQSGGSVGTLPDSMDNRDAGQPGEAPAGAPVKWSVGNQPFSDQIQAQDAAAEANAPKGQASRVAAAYSKNGQPGMAFQVQQNAQQAELTKLGLDQKHLDMANEMFDASLNRQGTHQALAQYVSDAPGDGKGGALKVQAVPSADGKSVTYNTVNPDGSLTPTGHTYSNDSDGILKAQQWLSRATPLSEKIKNLHDEEVLKRQGAKDAADAAFQQGTLKNNAENIAQKLEIASMRAAAAQAKKAGGSPFDRMDESDKLQYQNLFKNEQEASKALVEGVKGGTVTLNSPEAAFLQQQAAAARADRMKFEFRNGFHDPGEVASGITSGETDPAKITTGIQQAYALGGPSFGDKVKKAAQPALDTLLSKAAAPAAPGSKPTPAAKAAPAQRIPDPPPQMVSMGGMSPQKPSPAYAQWQQQYGDAYAAQQAAEAAAADQKKAAQRTKLDAFSRAGMVQNRVPN